LIYKVQITTLVVQLVEIRLCLYILNLEHCTTYFIETVYMTFQVVCLYQKLICYLLV